MKKLRYKIWSDIWNQTNNNVRKITKFNTRYKIWGSPRIRDVPSWGVTSFTHQRIREKLNET